MNKIIKRSTKYFIYIFSILIFLGLSIFFLSSLYKEELENFVIEELNKELNVKIQVKSLDISPFRKFPFISVVLTDATAETPSSFNTQIFDITDADTLFSASKIFLQFNIIDIIKSNYRLRRTHISGGHINLLIDPEGMVNYKLFKKQKKAIQSTVSLKLDGVKISDFRWNYINLSKNIHTSGDLKDISLKGNFSNTDYSLSVDGSFFIDSLLREDILYAREFLTALKVNMDVSNSLYKINKGELNINNMDFNLSGEFTTGEETDLNIQLRADGIVLRPFFTSFPLKIKFIEKYNPKGTLDFLANISGSLSQTQMPDIRVAFKLTNFKTHLREQNLVIEGLNAKGTYSNGKAHTPQSSSIIINDFSFKTGRTMLGGSFQIENLSVPYIKASISGNMDVRQLSDLIAVPGLSLEKGFVFPEIALNARLKDFNKPFNKSKITSAEIYGNIRIDSISGIIPGIHRHVDYLDGKIKVEGDTWYPEITAKSEESDIRIKVIADHLLGKLLFNRSLFLSGHLYSHYLNLKSFIVSESEKDTAKFLLPAKLAANFNYSIDSLIFGKFRAKNILADLRHAENQFSISSLKLTTLKGHITANGKLTQESNGNMLINSQSNLNNIDIEDLFYRFNNFTQDFIVSENLKGLISGNVNMSLKTENNFQPIYSTLIVDSDVTISNGELIGFEPIMQLSKYISLSELEHIKFSSLHNDIIINNENIYIPKMDINSSAFNISVSGTHNFNNYFEYKIKVNLSEILAKKLYKSKKENEEFGVIEKDDSEKTSIYLAINGTPSDFKVKYDKKEAIANIRSNLQNEKKTLKSILKQEFSLNKKDTIKLNDPGKESSGKFIMDWDKDDEKTDKNSGNNERKTKKPEFEIEW